MNKLWFLRRLDLFHGLTEPEIAWMGDLLRMRSCRTGDDVVMRPTGDRIYLLKEGRVRVMSGDTPVAVLCRGQFFGTSALFGAAATAQRVVALEDVVVCDADVTEFLAAMARNPRLAVKVVKLLARQLFELEQAVDRSTTDRVESRLADVVLRLAGNEPRAELHGLSQAELARMVGASRETVSRVIANWERAGVVRTGQRALQVLDEPALRRLLRS
jgi:CRP/FNR family cyclic AMP-dependent transcriptional regulator